MSADPFIGEITMFGGNFAPRGWAFCDGQLLAIGQNEALFSLLGTTYGGDGRTTFALPDLRGRVPLHPGTGPGLNTRGLGEKGGVESVALSVEEMPSHTHGSDANAVNAKADTDTPEGTVLAKTNEDIYSTGEPDIAMGASADGAAGGGQPHTNMQPWQGVNFIIALSGTFPSRS